MEADMIYQTILRWQDWFTYYELIYKFLYQFLYYFLLNYAL